MPIKTGKPTYWIYTHCYSDCRLHPTVALLLHQMQQQQLEAQCQQQAAQIQLTRALERLSTRPITVTNPPNPPRLSPLLSVRALQLKRISPASKKNT